MASDLFDQVAETNKNDLFDEVAAPAPNPNQALAQRWQAAGQNSAPMSVPVGPGMSVPLPSGAIDRLGAMAAWLSLNKGKVGDMAMQGGLPAVGQRIAGPIGGAVGGALGNAGAQIRQLSNNERQSFSPGEMASSALVGAVPLKTTTGKSFLDTAFESGKQSLINLAGEVAQTGIDEKRLPTPTEMAKSASAGAFSVAAARMIDAGKLAKKESIRKGEASYRDETMLGAHQSGLLLDPEISNPNALNKTVTSVAGQSQLQNEASKHNQIQVDRLARQEIGLPEGKPIAPIELTSLMDTAAKPYRELARISPVAADAVDSWKTNNFKAKNFWKAFNQTGNPEAFDRAVTAQADAVAAENIMLAEARNAGNPGLYRDVQDARVELAKIHAVSSAMNKGSGSINSRVIGGMLDAGVPLTGNLETIGRFQQAMPQVMGSPTQSSIVGKLGRTGAYAGTIAGGAVLGGPAGAAIGAGAGLATPAMAKKAALSDLYQKRMALPRYQTQTPDLGASSFQYFAQSQGR